MKRSILAALVAAFAFSGTLAGANIGKSPPPLWRAGCQHRVAFRTYRSEATRIYGERGYVRPAQRRYLAHLIYCQGSGARGREGALKLKRTLLAERAFRRSLTDVVVSGLTSTFGCGTSDGDSQTADGGGTCRPCIAMLSGQLDTWWWLTLRDYPHFGERVLQCDVGPASWTGRVVDITGVALEDGGISPSNYDNGPGSATLMR